MGWVFVVVACLHTRLARAERKPALLVAEPQVSVANRTNADLIYSSIVAGLHDALRRPLPTADRQFVGVFTERSINSEQRSMIAPIVLFSQFSSEGLDRALASRFKEAQEFRLARFLAVTIAELSPANYDVTLTLYQPGNPWKTLSEKRIGGCNEPIDELSATARELAARLIEPQDRAVQPQPRIDIQPPATDHTYLVGARITLDSCEIENPSGDQFTVTWKLPTVVHRRRVSLVLDHPQTLTVTQSIGNDTATWGTASVTITVIATPKADPVVQTCKNENEDKNRNKPCKEALRAGFDTASRANRKAGLAAGGAPFATQLPAENTEELNASPVPRAGQEPNPHGDESSQRNELRVIRLTEGINHIRLYANGFKPNQSAQWTQLSGPELGGLDLNQPQVDFNLESTQSGYYVFKLAIKAASQTDEARISFLAAPSVHADAGPPLEAKTGVPLLLDGSASYDVLGDTISYTWVLTEKDQQGDARIIDSHAIRPRFIADRPGTYQIRMYARVVRKLDDATLVEIATSETTVKVTRSNLRLFADTYNSTTTPEIFRIGALYVPSIARLWTTAHTFSYHRLAGLAAGSDKRGNLTAEAILGLGLRLQDRFLVDVFGRFYTRQDADRSHQITFGVGASFSISVVGALWLQIKGHLGPPTVFSSHASQLYAWESGIGFAYEL